MKGVEGVPTEKKRSGLFNLLNSTFLTSDLAHNFARLISVIFVSNMANFRFHLVFLACVFLLACSQEAEDTSRNRKKNEIDDISVLSALPTEIPAPQNNPITPRKTALGKLLFFDPILSGNKDVACATCHHPDFAFAEGIELSIGVNGRGFGSKRAFRSPNDIPFVKRNSQAVVNTAFNGLTHQTPADANAAPMFWDLRSKSLEKQAIEPIKTLEEMRGHAFSEQEIVTEVVRRLANNPTYVKLFREAFGTENAITEENMAKAIATYERSLVSINSRFDQYMRGDKKALSAQEVEGLNAFLKSGCAKCHNGPMLSDFKTHGLGVIDNEKLDFSDDGFEKSYAFRTPSLRNLRYTFPYMHNGKITTVRRVLEFYEDLAGGKIKNKHVNSGHIDPLVKHLHVDFKDIALIEEFLNTLNDNSYDKTMPHRVPSGLKVGGDI